MIKILLKAFILVCIILSIYFIVNPSACSNLMSGKVVNSMDVVPTFAPKDQDHSELLTPTGDQSLREQDKPANITEEEQPAPAARPAIPPAPVPVAQPVQSQQLPADNQPAAAQQPDATVASATDTRSLQPGQPAPSTPGYSVAEMDYAIASRYVELENEYSKQKKDMKKAAQEISYIVMDDFEMTPSEWEAFLQRATVGNLFEKVRQEQAAKAK